jgi:adenosylcobinamide-GDP ribazoletransferase
MALLTGAMHEDGLADSADGLFGGWEKTRRLEIMRDSRIGTYGMLALLYVALGRWAALSFLMATGHNLAPLLTAAVLSRAALPVVMHALPPARSDGLGAATGAPPRLTVVFGLILALLIGLLLTGWAVIPATLAAAGAALVVALTAQAKIGGQTGDILGATQQLAELAILATLCALI